MNPSPKAAINPTSVGPAISVKMTLPAEAASGRRVNPLVVASFITALLTASPDTSSIVIRLRLFLPGASRACAMSPLFQNFQSILISFLEGAAVGEEDELHARRSIAELAIV